jgi:HK97 family phage major capsid protein/HK97 family phage prohead protease
MKPKLRATSAEEILEIGTQERSGNAEGVKLDLEARTVEFPFSSEYPVERWFGKEVLSHAEGAADLSRMNNGAPLLWNHDTDSVIGVIEKSWMGADKRGYVQARFSKNNPQADMIMKEVADGILRNVSFAYQIREMECLNPGSDEEREYLATKWLAYEASIVSVPADPTVGIGRSRSAEKHEVRVINRHAVSVKEQRMDEEQKKAEAARIEAETKVREQALRDERVRVAAITALGERFQKTDLARQLNESGKSVEEARTAFLEAIGERQVPLSGSEGVVGLSEKEKSSFSFLRAINAMLYPQDRRMQEAAKFEREVSDAAQVAGGKSARGFMVPVDILRTSIGQKRDLTVGTSTQGGNLVATDLLASSFIEILRNKSIVQAAGATVLNGLVGNIAIPKQTGAASAYWVAESGAPTESTQAIGQVTMSPHTVGAFNDYSRKLLLQSSIDVESFVRMDLAAVLALELDRVALYGTGSSNQPTGIKATLAGGNQEKNWAAGTPTWAEVIAMETAVTSANADIGVMKYLTNATLRGALKGAVKVSSYPVFIMDSDGSMNGYPTLVSNQVASGDMFFGVWSQLLMGFWSGLDLLIDPYTASTTGTVRIVALQDCDIAIRHSESFCRGNDTP